MSNLDSIALKISETDFKKRPEDLPYSYWKGFCKLSFVGCGTSRVAFSYGNDKVVKFNLDIDWLRGNFAYGRNQNEKEYSLYNEASSKQKKHLAEVYDHGSNFDWTTMKYYPNPIGSNFSTSRKNDISSRLEEDGVILNDYTDDNIALHNGNVVIVDYGMGVELK